jgi:DNA-binding MarR family transcriptional regulator
LRTKNQISQPQTALFDQREYLTRSSIHAALARLSASNGPLVVGNYNKRGYDRTNWYAFRDNQTQRYLQVEPVYFRVEDAEKYGVVEAVVLMNLAYWIRQNRTTKPDYQYHKLSPQDLAKHLPYTKSTIQRALKHLADSDARVLRVRRPVDGRGAFEYAFADQTKLQLYGTAQTTSCPNPDMSSPVLDGSNANPDMVGSNLELGDSNPDMGGSERDMAGAKLDDNTILIDNSLKAFCLKEGSLKEESFQSACVSGSFSSLADANLDSISTSGPAPNLFKEPVDGKTKVAGETKVVEPPVEVSWSSSRTASSFP